MMHTPPMLEIRFPSYTSGGPPRCGPKSTLAGVVYLNIAEPLTASCLSLNLVGSERISLAPSSVNITTAVSSAVFPKERSVKKIYFNQTSILWGDSKLRTEGELAAGIHMFHFSCEFPRVNYPQSKTTAEYVIKYVLQAKLLNARSSRESTITTATQPITYVPETVAPIIGPRGGGADDVGPRSYTFCDNAVDIDEQQWAFHVQAMGLQQAFRPGDTVDLQLRITGQRPLRKARFSVVEQTDCFYPQVPSPQEEQLDLGRRLWTSRRSLSGPTDLAFERDSCVLVPDLCSEHMDTARVRGMGGGGGNATYYAHLRVQLPRDLTLLHETGYLRFTCFAELTLLSSASWGGHTRRAVVRLPIPVATRVLAEPPFAGDPAGSVRGSSSLGGCDVGGRRGTSASSAHTVVDAPGVLHEHTAAAAALEALGEQAPVVRRGRSIVDLGARLQQLIPRRTQSSALGIQGIQGGGGGAMAGWAHRPNMRSASHGRPLADHPPMWSAFDMPPLPAAAATPASSTQSSVYSSPMAQPAVLAGDPSSPASIAATVTSLGGGGYPADSPSAMLTMGAARPGFSMTFLARLPELYHADANAQALAALVGGKQPDPNGVIPSAIVRSSAASSTAAAAGLPHFAGSSLLSSRRSSRMSVQSVAGVMSASECVRPQIEAIMTSYRDPVTSHVSTWSALGAQRDSGVSKSSSTTQHSSARYSRMSSMSVSSNDTACAASSGGGGQFSLAKDFATPPLPQPPLPHVAAIDASPARHCERPF
ncbi:hypothetical protein LPJ53_002351 [Coemansia erecta]|uniref:Arrestin-like N-terminal domain-containing protein n=1 Tax=Coemansia erecta TaxID=147472 RepID=A0A9W7Y3Q4_9FUNG|nr:hypothetical protein LPJ53_002351 [Coemansia erecta]